MNGQTAEGLPLLRRCVQQAEGLYSEGSPRRSVVLPLHLNCLADALQKTGELEEARELLHRSIGLRSVRADSSTRVWLHPSLPITWED